MKLLLGLTLACILAMCQCFEESIESTTLSNLANLKINDVFEEKFLDALQEGVLAGIPTARQWNNRWYDYFLAIVNPRYTREEKVVFLTGTMEREHAEQVVDFFAYVVNL
ncbi:unnamed protein product [Caenorhabditis auriculariae]|uniref:Uncharacterized protein n=1 Tax=Caenorhabditis auriculariae TaxID=2777116 RepID=A0A8S1HHD6_9PELO|nr:unnamed protein product [Caenorhabditis auriculariae]